MQDRWKGQMGWKTILKEIIWKRMNACREEERRGGRQYPGLCAG